MSLIYVIFYSLDIGKGLNLKSQIVNFKNKKSNLVWRKRQCEISYREISYRKTVAHSSTTRKHSYLISTRRSKHSFGDNGTMPVTGYSLEHALYIRRRSDKELGS